MRDVRDVVEAAVEGPERSSSRGITPITNNDYPAGGAMRPGGYRERYVGRRYAVYVILLVSSSVSGT